TSFGGGRRADKAAASDHAGSSCRTMPDSSRAIMGRKVGKQESPSYQPGDRTVGELGGVWMARSGE
ncbi:hypothetical protein HPP92_029074, partial [Vanilla planifolia]